jgi:hypothetical protein
MNQPISSSSLTTQASSLFMRRVIAVLDLPPIPAPPPLSSPSATQNLILDLLGGTTLEVGFSDENCSTNESCHYRKRADYACRIT